MAFNSDRIVRTDTDRAQMETSSIPNDKVSASDVAFLIQRADVPKDFKGIIGAVYELGSVALKPYLDPLSARLDEVEVNLALVEESDPIASQAVAELEAVVDTLPTTTQFATVKDNVKTVQDQYKQLDTSKADKADLDAAQAAIKALQDALAALPPSGATPEQLKAVDDRVKALESAISKAESSKGILTFDERSHALIGGVLYGGLRRLVRSDIERLNERAGIESTGPYAAMNGAGRTSLTNGSNQWLSWFTVNQLRLWRIEIQYQNNNWAVRNFKRNGTQIIALNKWADTHTSIYKPKASTGNEALTSLQFVDDAPASTEILNLYVSVTDTLNPTTELTLNGTVLKSGDRFRFDDGTVSTLYTYQGIHAASGAWWAKPVAATNDSNVALYSVVNPRLDNHDNAIAALENTIDHVGNTRIRREPRSPQEDEIDSTWDIWIRFENNISTAIYQEFKWAGANIAVTDGSHTLPLSYTEAQAKYDAPSKLYTIPIGGLDFQYTKEAVSQVGQTSFPAPCYANQFPNAGLKFSNIRYEAYNDVVGGTVIANGGFIPRADGDNLTAIQFSSFIKRIVYFLTPLSGEADVIFEVKI